MQHNYSWPMGFPEIRCRLGEMWGLERSLTRTELARALNLSDKSGGNYIARMERVSVEVTGPLECALRMMLAGAIPHTMSNVVKPGYPRGAVD